ncbi:hypothetical protein [Streptomyces sp. NPDC127039]|uniref:hypothetical protein n=1 Tax=Streptomyces sp. NPDC127039 TaxID=3347115 RepID=UPI00364B30CD
MSRRPTLIAALPLTAAAALTLSSCGSDGSSEETGDKEKDAVLADGEQSIKAVDLAVVNQDPLDKAYLYYYEGEAAAGTQEFIQAYVKENARVTGAYRFYEAVVNVRGKDSASLVYCEDQGKAYDMYLKPKKVNKTPVTKDSYVLYNTQLSAEVVVPERE